MLCDFEICRKGLRPAIMKAINSIILCESHDLGHSFMNVRIVKTSLLFGIPVNLVFVTSAGFVMLVNFLTRFLLNCSIALIVIAFLLSLSLCVPISKKIVLYFMSSLAQWKTHFIMLFVRQEQKR